MRSLRSLAFLLLIGLVLAGCDQKALLQKFVPKEDDTLARRFLELVRAEDYKKAEEMLDPSLQGEAASTGLRELHGVLAQGEPVSWEPIGCNVSTMASPAGTTRTTNLSYQIHFPTAWVSGGVTIVRRGDAVSILAARFQPTPDSLEVINRLSLQGKSAVHYAVLAACIAIPLFILCSMLICIVSPVQRKWLWILFILLGVCQFRLNWTTGAFDLQPFSFLVLGASAFRPSPYAPWIFGCAFPLGAVLYLVLRRDLIARALKLRLQQSSVAQPPPL